MQRNFILQFQKGKTKRERLRIFVIRTITDEDDIYRTESNLESFHSVNHRLPTRAIGFVSVKRDSVR